MKRLLVAISVVSLVACQTSGEQNVPLKIGFIGPLTGDSSSSGSVALNQLKQIIAEINDSGGVDGRLVQVIAEDGRCKTFDATNAAAKLINVDQVVIILGGLCHEETTAIVPIADAAGVPVLPLAASAADIKAALLPMNTRRE